MIKRYLSVLLIVGVIIVGVFGIGGGIGFAAPKEVNIGLLVILSGGGADLGVMSRNGAQMAVEDINAAGGIKALGGAKVNLVIRDITSQASQCVMTAERMFTRQKLAAAIGCGRSEFTFSILPIVEKHRVPLVTSSIADKITASGCRYVFEECPRGSQFGHMQVDFLKFLQEKYNIPVRRVGVTYEDSSYGTATGKGIKERCKKAGYNVVLDQPYSASITDATPLVTKMRAANIDVAFLVSYTVDGQLILTTMDTMGFKPLVIGGGAAFIWSDIVSAIGDKINGVCSVGSWSWDAKIIYENPARRDVTRRYKERYGHFMEEQAGEHYGMVWLIKEAIERAGSADPEKVRDSLANIKITPEDGMVAFFQPGYIEFDENGRNIHVYPTVIQWQNQEPRTVYPERSATAEVVRPK